MTIQRKRVAKRLASGLLAGALALGGLAISGGSVSAKTPSAPSTQRLAGDDRYETAVAIARQYTDVGLKGMIVASGESPYDALAASALAAKTGAPIVLVKKDSVPSAVLDLISDNITNFRNAVAQKVYFVGGTSAISDDVKDAVMAAVTASDPIPMASQRVAGDDRYATAKAIADLAGITDKDDTMIIVNGSDGRWADALSAGNLVRTAAWPVILTGDGGLNATAKAAVDAFIALAGSSKKFVLIGGESVLPASIVDYLVSKNVKPETIYRRGGVDRYDTNVKVNLSLIGATNPLLSGAFAAKAGAGTTEVVLASGVSPWDALTAGPWAAANGKHLVLTSAPAPGPFTAQLVGALSVLLDGPSKVWMVGGTAVVPNSVRDVVIATAQGAADTTTTLTDCVAGRMGPTFTVAGGTWSIAETDIVTASANAYFTSNGTKDTVTDFISSFTDLGTKADGSTRTFTTFGITMGRKMVAGETIAFTGVNEVTPGGDIVRSVAGSSCVVEADTTAPVATIVPRTDGANLNSIYVSLSEPIVNNVGVVQTTSNASLSAATYWSFNGAWSTQKTATLSATNLDSSYTKYLVTVEGAIAVASLATVELAAAAVVDQAGNTAGAAASGTAAPDSSAPTYTLGTVVCNADSTAVAAYSASPLTLTAKTAGAGGSWAGRKGNGLKLSVINSRGLTVPTIALDAAAGTITVTADTGYHTVADLSTVMTNIGLDSDWTASGTGLLAATLVPAQSVSGEDDCRVTVTYNEPADAIASQSLTVNGVVTTGTGYNTGIKTSFTLRFPAKAVGAVPVVLSATTENSLGVTGATSGSSTLP